MAGVLFMFQPNVRNGQDGPSRKASSARATLPRATPLARSTMVAGASLGTAQQRGGTVHSGPLYLIWSSNIKRNFMERAIPLIQIFH